MILSRRLTASPGKRITGAADFLLRLLASAKHSFPSVEAGKFMEEGERGMMPLPPTGHHIAADGYHVKIFLESLQEDIRNFNSYLKPEI